MDKAKRFMAYSDMHPLVRKRMIEQERNGMELTCRNGEGVYRLINGRLYHDRVGQRSRILSFCLDDPEQSPVVEVPIFEVAPYTLFKALDDEI